MPSDGLYAWQRIPHEPSEACDGFHCHIHGVCESDYWVHLVCVECGHAYLTRRALRGAHRRETLAGYPWWRRVFFRTARITFCPYCIHDW